MQSLMVLPSPGHMCHFQLGTAWFGTESKGTALFVPKSINQRLSGPSMSQNLDRREPRWLADLWMEASHGSFAVLGFRYCGGHRL